MARPTDVDPLEYVPARWRALHGGRFFVFVEGPEAGAREVLRGIRRDQGSGKVEAMVEQSLGGRTRFVVLLSRRYDAGALAALLDDFAEPRAVLFPNGQGELVVAGMGRIPPRPVPVG